MKKDVWLRLKGYHFDNLVPPHMLDRVTAAFAGSDASTKAFANKIARKLGWKPRFALQAIAEYKKFAYLGVTSDISVTPSKVIDQVWHEHPLFSRGYREFCRDVLQHAFDHNPELLPSHAQTEVFQQQYDATLELYEDEFNVAPPEAIWGTPKFKVDTGFRDERRKRQLESPDASRSNSDEIPLYMLFSDTSGSYGFDSHGLMMEFGGGGGFSGGGGGDSWNDAATSHSDSGSDAGSTDSGGSDSSSSSGSSCSSSCSGGGCSS